MVSIDSYSLMYDNFGRGPGGLPRSSGRPRGTRGTSLANAQDFCVGRKILRPYTKIPKRAAACLPPGSFPLLSLAVGCAAIFSVIFYKDGIENRV
jgi:hypothetical protein